MTAVVLPPTVTIEGRDGRFIFIPVSEADGTLPRLRVADHVIGGRMSNKKPIPADFHTFAPGKSLLVLANHYGAALSTVARWRRETGVAPAEPGKGRRFERAEMPDGFALVAPTLTVKQLRERYGRSQSTIAKWLNEAGVEARNPPPSNGGRIHLSCLSQVHRPVSRAEQAADFLRRFGPVYRCNDMGRAKPNGDRWSRNGFVLTDDEIIERAERNGWRPDAWKEVRAA